MAGYGSDDGDYYSDGDWGVEDNGGYFSDDYWEQQEFGNSDNVSESHLGTGMDDNHEEQDDSGGSYDEYKGIGRDDNHEEQDDNEGSYDEYEEKKSEEVNDEPGHGVGGLGVPGNVIVNPGQDRLQQTMTGGIGKQSGVDRGQHPMTSYEWSSRIRHQDKQTGDYARTAVRHTLASGDTLKERSTGRVGFKDEYKQSTTVTIGNKRGYSEYHREERFRTVNFGKSSGSSTNKKI